MSTPSIVPAAPTPVRAELDLLREQLALVRAGDSPRVVALTGPPGIGKTTILKAFMGELLAEDARSRPRVGYGAAGRAGEDYATVRWALRSLLENEQGRGHAAARRTVNILLAVAPEWLGAVPAIGSLLRALAITVETARRGGQPNSLPLADQLVALILELADERPVVLLLDDLHWADENTAGLLFDVGRAVNEAKTRMLIVVAYRSAGNPDRPISRTVRSLVRYVPTTTTIVARIDPEQAAEIVRQAVGVQPPTLLSAWLCARTDGNPLFLMELVRSLGQRGFPPPGVWNEPELREAIDMLESSGAELPESVEAVLRELLDDLTPTERRVLDVCAVLGEPVEPADLLAVADLPESVGRQALRDLFQRRRLLVSAEGDLSARYRFTYAMLPDLLLQDLRADRYDYGDLNRRCAEHLESRGDRADFAIWERLARHWYEAGRLDCAIAAGHRAVWAGYQDKTIRERGFLLSGRINRWAAAGADPDLAAQSEMVVAEALQALHRPIPSYEALRRAEALAPDGSAAQAHAMFFRSGMIAATNPDRGNYDLARRAAAHLAVIVARPAQAPINQLHRHLMVTALFTIAGLAAEGGAWDTAQEALDEATQIDVTGSDDWGDWSHEVLLHRAGILFAQRRWTEAVDGFRAALQLAQDRRNPSWLTGSHGRLGIACCYAGLEAEGLAQIKEGLRLEREVQASPEGVASRLRQLGEFHITQDRLLEAAELLILAERLYLEIGAEGANATARAIAHIRETYGAEAFDAWHDQFRPERSIWAGYAMLWGFARFEPYARNPVLTAGGNEWESLGVLCPAPVTDGGGVTLLYQAVGSGPGTQTRSVVGLAESRDGVLFTRSRAAPLLTPAGPSELPGYTDLRLSRVRDQLVLTYQTGTVAAGQVEAARGNDPRGWTKAGPMVLGGHEVAEPVHAAVLLPQPIDGQWWMYFGTNQIWAAWTDDPMLRQWHVVRRPVLSPRADSFDSLSVETGPPPVLLPEGIVLVYNGVDQARRRTVGQALISVTDPTRVLRRSPTPVLAAAGMSASGLVNHNDAWLLYYSTPESTIAVASTTYPSADRRWSA